MKLTHLEDNIPASYVNEYINLFGHLQEPTRTALGYTLDLASYLSNMGLARNYLIFGGYAVLSHLMNTFGTGFAKTWRGSEDIDMIGDQRVLQAIKSGYEVYSDRASPNLKDKRTVKLSGEAGVDCKIDFSFGNIEDRFEKSEVHNHLGIDLNVPSSLRLIRGKLLTPKKELKHYGDILGMLSVLEVRGCSPDQVVDYFNAEECGEVCDRLRIAQERFSNDRLGIFPSGDFSTSLSDKLKKKAKRFAR